MTETLQSAASALKTLDMLLDRFAEGVTPSDVTKRIGASPQTAGRVLNTLLETGHAEQIPETGRWRASHAFARKAIYIMQSLDGASARLEESRMRLTGGM